MAKQLVNPIERHAEKAVLGFAGLILIGVIAVYLVTSPNQTELGTQNASPKTIDGLVAQKAASVRQRIRTTAPSGAEFESIKDGFAIAIDPFDGTTLREELPSAVAIGPPVPIIDAQVVSTTDKGGLVDVVPFGKPKVTSGRSTLKMKEPGAESADVESVPVDWVTVSAVFDRKEQTERQLRRYGLKWKDVIFGPLEVERRERRPDGTFSEGDWKPLQPWPAAKLAALPEIPLVQEGKELVVPRDDYKEIDKFKDSVNEKQLRFIRPLMPPIDNGTKWAFPVITSIRDVAKQDWDYERPTGGDPDNPPLRYPGYGEEDEPEKELTPEQEIKRDLAKCEKLLAEAAETQSADKAIEAFNLASSIHTSSQTSSSDKTKAKKLMDQAELLEKDIKKQKKRPLPSSSGPKGSGQPGGPSSPQHPTQPIQQLWAHDAAAGSLMGGHTYQYRIRPVILNRLVGQPGKFDDPQDATKMLLTGPWSEPSDPVTIEPASQFFLANVDDRNEGPIATVEVYQWFEGIWVMHRGKFGIGAAVAATERVPTPDPEDPEGVYPAEVDFMADATVVDIDAERRFRERKTSGDGVKVLPAKGFSSVVFVDKAGRLHENFVEVDKHHPAKTLVKNRVWQPPKKKAERPTGNPPPKKGEGP